MTNKVSSKRKNPKSLDYKEVGGKEASEK